MNYIAKRISFKILEAEGNIEKVRIDGKVYRADYSPDPEYIDDGVLDISYYRLEDEDGDIVADMILAFDRREDVTEPQEWADEFDVENMYVLRFV